VNRKERLRNDLKSIKNFYGKWTLPWALFIFFIISILLFLFNPIIQRDALFWFFSSISQSMAAVFAIIGMFAIFRYEYLSNRLNEDFKTLRDEIGVISFPISTVAYRSFHVNNALLAFLEKYFKDLEENRQEVPTPYTNVRVYTMLISKNQGVRDATKELAMIPMTEILISFVLSIFSLLAISTYFSASATINHWGVVAIFLTLFFIVLSMISIMKYFITCFPRVR